MSSKSIRLSDHSGKIFEASELLPADIVQDTIKMDDLSPVKAKRYVEPASNQPNQEQLLMLRDRLKENISKEERALIMEVLIVNGINKYR